MPLPGWRRCVLSARVASVPSTSPFRTGRSSRSRLPRPSSGRCGQAPSPGRRTPCPSGRRTTEGRLPRGSRRSRRRQGSRGACSRRHPLRAGAGARTLVRGRTATGGRFAARNVETQIALRGVYWRSSYLVEIPDFAPPSRDEFAFFSLGWSSAQCEAQMSLFVGYGRMYYGHAFAGWPGHPVALSGTPQQTRTAPTSHHGRVALLAAKLVLAPSFVVRASLVARRFGARIGGVVGALPVVAGPILLVYALAHGRGFGADAAAGTLLGLVSLTAFVVVYSHLAGRTTWGVRLLAGWIAFLVATAVLSTLSIPAAGALALAWAAIAAALVVLPRASHDH